MFQTAMYVCVCFAVTDKEVQRAIENGAETREEVTRACKAGGDCGSCHGRIERMLEQARADGVIPCDGLVRKPAA